MDSTQVSSMWPIKITFKFNIIFFRTGYEKATGMFSEFIIIKHITDNISAIYNRYYI